MLDEYGCPACPGYSKNNSFIYNKENIRKHRGRIKEWDFYVVSDGRYKVEMNFFNISWVAALTAQIVELRTGKRFSDTVICPSSPDKFTLSPGASDPFLFSFEQSGRRAVFETTETSHRLDFCGKAGGSPFEIHMEGKMLPVHESLATPTPFEDGRHFYYTEKMNCMEACVKVRAGGKTILPDPEKAFMTIDRGRGVWPYRNKWIWSNGSTRIDGRPFGFEMTWGFGDDSNATATALFYDGRCHKIGAVHLENDSEKENFSKPWHFVSEDGRLDLTLTPECRVTDGIVFAGVMGHKSIQTYGYFNGYAVLDDGTRLKIKDMFAFAEKVHNAW